MTMQELKATCGGRMTHEVYKTIYRATEEIGAAEYDAQKAAYQATHKTMRHYRHNASALHRLLCQLMTCDSLDAYGAAQAVQAIDRAVGWMAIRETRAIAQRLIAALYAIAADTAEVMSTR